MSDETFGGYTLAALQLEADRLQRLCRSDPSLPSDLMVDPSTLLVDIERLVAERDHWQARAEKAEAERDVWRQAVEQTARAADGTGGPVLISDGQVYKCPDGSVIVDGKVWRWKMNMWGPLNSKGERWIEGVTVPVEVDDE